MGFRERNLGDKFMKLIRILMPFLDDILMFCGLVSMIIASYLVNAILGTYVLGIAFFVAAFITGTVLRNPALQKTLGDFLRRK